jgi:hypothetical protein
MSSDRGTVALVPRTPLDPATQYRLTVNWNAAVYDESGYGTSGYGGYFDFTTVAAPAPPPDLHACVAAPIGLVSSWRAEGDTTDVRGLNNASAAQVSFAPGRVGTGFQFAPGDFVDIAPSPTLENQQYTIEAWVRPDGPGPNDDTYGSVVIQKMLDVNTTAVSIWWSALDGRFTYVFGNASSAVVRSAHSFSTGDFHHVAATYDGVRFMLFVDGALEGEMALTANIEYGSGVSWSIGSTAAYFRSLGYPRTWNGIIDEVSIYNRALSQAEIQGIVDAAGFGKCVSQQVALIDFESLSDSVPFGSPFSTVYQGVTWSNWLTYAPYSPPYQPAGVNAIYTAVDSAGFTFSERVFLGAWFTRHPQYPGAIYFELYLHGSLVAVSGPLADTPPALTFLPSGYAGLVDEVRVRSANPGSWLMDNVTF